jgi:hypothetical protein
MVLVIKLTSFAFNVFDGRRPDKVCMILNKFYIKLLFLSFNHFALKNRN